MLFPVSIWWLLICWTSWRHSLRVRGRGGEWGVGRGSEWERRKGERVGEEGG